MLEKGLVFLAETFTQEFLVRVKKFLIFLCWIIRFTEISLKCQPFLSLNLRLTFQEYDRFENWDNHKVNRKEKWSGKLTRIRERGSEAERCAKINIRNFCSASETIIQTVQVLHFSVILVVKGVLHDENCLLGQLYVLRSAQNYTCRTSKAK